MNKISFSLILALFFVKVSAQRLEKTIKEVNIGGVLSMDISLDGKTAVTVGLDNRVVVTDIEKSEKIKITNSPQGKLYGVNITPDQKYFATVGEDTKLLLWELKTGNPKIILKGHTQAIKAIESNPVNGYVVTGSEDKTLIIFDPIKKTQIETLEGHSKQINSIKHSPDGNYIVSCSDDNTVRVWDAYSGQDVRTIETSLKGIISLGYSPDGSFIVIGDKLGKIELWNPNTGSKLGDIEGFSGSVNSLSISSDARYLAAAGSANTIVIYDIELLQQKLSFSAHKKSKGISSIKFVDKENKLISAGLDGNISVWQMNEIQFGPKKMVKDSQPSKLICSAIILNEKEKNGIIESSDNAYLSFDIKNEGLGTAYDLEVTLNTLEIIQGLSFDQNVYLGNIPSGKSIHVKIPLSVLNTVETTASTFKVNAKDANGSSISEQMLNFQTKGAQNSYIMISDYKYSSGTGKAEIGAPITLSLTLFNVSDQNASNITISYKFPQGVNSLDKLIETISFLPNEQKTISVKFQPSDKFLLENINIDLAILGTPYSNVNDVDLILKMGEELPVNAKPFISKSETSGEILYRGDPLKGLNIATARKEMEIGEYYALVIGIDSYSGNWNPLKNAVNDAKAIENVLKSKYNFSYFKTLYDKEATRESIIEAMEWLVNNVREKDNVLIYYSGHGDFKQELNKGYWVPVDATTTSASKYISNSDLQTFLGGIKSKHTLLISDACFSGDIFRGNTEYVPYENSEKYYQRVNDLVSRQAITSGGIEPVMDGGRDGHSVFAYYLLKTLENNDYKYFDAGQLYQKIKIPVVNNSSQSPNFSPINNTGDEGGQFIFMKN